MKEIKQFPIGEIKPLTGLRFLAALSVFFYHCRLHEILPDFGTKINTIFSNLAIGVNAFFLLSGVVLTLGFATKAPKPVPARRFMFKRFSKLAPVYWSGMLASVAVVFALQAVPADLPVLVFLNSLFLNAWFPGVAMKWFGSGSWSLGCEVFFYTCFCFILPRLITLSAKALSLILVSVWILSAIPGLIHGLHPALELFNWVYSFPPARIAEFVSGIIIALLIFRHQWRVPPMLAVVSVVVLLVYLVLFGWRMAGYVPHNWIVTPLLSVIIGALCRPSRLFTWLGNPVMIALGRWSYSFYIWQIVIMLALEILQKQHRLHTYNQWLMTATLLSLNLLLAYLSYVLIEEPAHSYLNSKYSPRPTHG